jgi:SAM-dependent methyltransferase
MDTLSWARLGASVTGLDFSGASIEAARGIAREAGLEARFVVGDVYDAPVILRRTFDIVYTGVGALCWLPDLRPWADAVAALLRPGGLLYLFEFHPVEWMLEPDAATGLALRFDYFTPAEGYREGGAVSYADAGPEDQDQPTVQWNHSLGEVVTALASADLLIEELRELEGSVLERWPGMEPLGDGMFRMSRPPNVPLMYVLRARRRA